MDIGRELQALRTRLAKVERAGRLQHASIDNAAVQVKDSNGGLRGIIGVQADGTTAINIVNGPPPPQPSDPIVASVLGGVTVSWDGQFADGSPAPLDWSRVEVHASITADYDPVPATLQGTIETAQGATIVVSCDAPVYIRLMARNTSGAASPPSTAVGPVGPTAVVADDVLDGIITTVKLADDAVTAAKVAAGAVGSTALADGAVLSAKLADAAVAVGKIADSAVTGPAIASSAVSADKIAANAVAAANIQAGAVTAAAVAAGAITTDKLTVTGGANLLTDPSFEGPYTAALIASVSYASQDTTKGNGSPTSLKIDAVSSPAAYRSVQLTLLPTLPGEQLYLAVDYYVSSDWAGTDVNFQVRWETDTGTILSYGKASTTSPVREAWTRLTGTFTAPASATKARIRVESGNATAGTVWWDNAALRPVVAGTQIQDGAITTAKVIAGAIQTTQLDTGSVNADKIASGAVTTDKLDALAVTADKIAANAITVGKLAAGAVDATAIAADAITGKTITGGTINGTTITGGILQTASSGERITLNEAGANKVLVYDSTGTGIGELSVQGLIVKGSSGAVIWLKPNVVYPQMQLYNAANTNAATVQVVEPTTGDANLESFSGLFTGSGYTDMVWRTYLGRDFAVMERRRATSGTSTTIGGRVSLDASHATLQFLNTDTPAQTTSLNVYTGYAQLDSGRLRVLPVADSNACLYVEAAPTHAGNLAALYRDGIYRLTVDKDGNTTISGNLTVSGVGQRLTKRRTSDATKTNTITPATDSQITFTVDANAVYQIDGYLKYSGANDIVIGWTFPTGTLGEWQGLGNGTTVVSGTASNGTQQDTISTWGYTVRTESTDIANTRTHGGVTTTAFGIHIRGLIRVGSTAGTFALQWAQGTSGASATTLYTDSHIRLEKVA